MDKKLLVSNIFTLVALALLVSLLPGVLSRDKAVLEVVVQCYDIIENLTCMSLRNLQMQNALYGDGGSHKNYFIYIWNQTNESQDNNPGNAG